MRLYTRIAIATTLSATTVSLGYAYSVQPMVYTITPTGSGSTARLTIVNSKEGQLNVEIEPYSVVADDAGKRTFTAAPDDFLIFPPQATIAGDKSQLFQVRYTGAPTMAKGRAYVLRVRQTNTTAANTPDTSAKVQAQLMMSVNFNTTALVQPRDLMPDVIIERDLAPDASGTLRGRITNRGNGIADLSSLGWALDRAGKQEALTGDQIAYGEALFLEPGRSRDIAISDKIKAPGKLVLTQPGERRGARRS